MPVKPKGREVRSGLVFLVTEVMSRGVNLAAFLCTLPHNIFISGAGTQCQ